MNNQHNDPSDSQTTLQLTAYLDGEMSPEEIREVEDRLAIDETYRSKMQQLQKAWDVLDILPSSQAKRSFTQSTMKLVVDDATQLSNNRRSKFWTWAFRGLVLVLIPVLASAAAYFASQYFQQKPLRQLANNLSVVKDFDVYNCDENITIEFLERLADDTSVFGLAAPLSNTHHYANYLSDDLDIDSIAFLNNESKKLLRINHVNFQNLDEASKARVRKLYEEVKNHPRSMELKENLYRYYHWLRSQPSTNSAEIRDTEDIDLRISKIKSMVNEQLWPSFASQLKIDDRHTLYLALMYLVSIRGDAIQDSYLQLFGQNEDDFIEMLSRNHSHSDKPIFAHGRRLREVYEENPDMVSKIITASDVEEITNTLFSAEAKSNFDFARQYATDASQLLAIWMFTAYEHHFQPKPEDLNEFYNNLAKDVQESLDNELPADRQQRLQDLWNEKYAQ